jgi:small subunit ribosomal protein S6
MLMKYYETLYLINPNLSEEEYRDVVIKFNDVVEKKKGVFVKVDEWGKKSLAYQIKKFDKGYYVLSRYCGEGDFVAEFEREMNLDERILQFQTIKLSDQVDPEELKAEVEEAKKKEAEKAEPAEKERSEEKTESETKEEGDDGVQ